MAILELRELKDRNSEINSQFHVLNLENYSGGEKNESAVEYL